LNSNYLWVLDDDELDEDIITLSDTILHPGHILYTDATDQWIFEAEEAGTTTIRLEYADLDTFEVEITVEE